MVDDIPQLQAQLDAARHELQAALDRVTQLETQFAAAQPSALSTAGVAHAYRAFDYLLESCMIIGFDWRCLYINEIGLRYSRLTREQMVGRSLLESFPGFEQTEAYSYLRQGLVERKANDYETEFSYPDGPSTWYAFRVQPVPEGVFILSQDITERKNAEAQRRKLYRTLSVLSDTNQAIVRLRHNLPTLLRTICKIAVEAGGFYTAWIAEISADQTRMLPIAWAGLSDTEFDKFDMSISAEEPQRRRPALQALFTGQRVIINNTRTSEDLAVAASAQNVLLAHNIGSLVFYPLKVNGTVRALFSLSASETNFFDTEELRLLDEMAGDLEYAMEFAEQESKREQAESSLRRYAQRLEVLHTIDHALLRAQDIYDVIANGIENLNRLVPCERIGVVLYDEQTCDARVYQTSNSTASEVYEGVRTAQPSPAWLAQFDDRGVKNVGDMRLVPAPYPLYEIGIKEGLRSILHILLKVQGQTIGLLNLIASTPDFFTLEHEQIAAEVGGQIAIAIRQMRLTQAIERHTAELETRVEERTRQLRAENERIQAILHYSLEGIAFLDADFRLVETNAAFRKLVNLAAYETKPISMFDILHVDDHRRFSEFVKHAIAESSGHRFEIRLIKAEHSVVNAEIGLQNITDDGFVCSFHDISDRQRAEQALRLALEAEKQANILKSRFVAMASHEFRTPLAAILASTETLTLYRDRMKDDDISNRLDNIRRQVSHMAGIMEKVLQLGHMQSGRLEFQPTQANLPALCAELVEEFNNRPATNNRVIYAAPDAPILLRLDVSLMRQSITNLIGNALKYSENPLPVHVQLSKDGTGVTLVIRDQGIGIPAKDFPYLFEPFHRASNVGSISGTGLGLSITKQAIELHGGAITVDSQEGHGTTFTITLPVTTLNLT
ncbi:MAG: GAF domain-containing protein [Chloroflexi bacterium]|nr:GAF domain-containing protein [Chloroflexota bacterium]